MIEYTLAELDELLADEELEMIKSHIGLGPYWNIGTDDDGGDDDRWDELLDAGKTVKTINRPDGGSAAITLPSGDKVVSSNDAGYWNLIAARNITSEELEKLTMTKHTGINTSEVGVRCVECKMCGTALEENVATVTCPNCGGRVERMEAWTLGAVLPNGRTIIAVWEGRVYGVVLAMSMVQVSKYATWAYRTGTKHTYSGHYFDGVSKAALDFDERVTASKAMPEEAKLHAYRILYREQYWMLVNARDEVHALDVMEGTATDTIRQNVSKVERIDFAAVTTTNPEDFNRLLPLRFFVR